MSKRLSILLAFAFVVAMNVAAYAEVQNVKVSGDLQFFGVSRYGFNLSEEETDITATPMVARLRVDADLTDNITATVGIRNERIWGDSITPTSNNDTHIMLGFVTLKEFLYSPLTLKLGLQPVVIGNGLLLADADTNQTATGPFSNQFGDLSTRKEFDAIVAILDYSPTTVTLGYLKGSEGNVAENGDDLNGYAISLGYDFGNKITGALDYILLDKKKGDVNNFGVRLNASPIENLDLAGELVYQLQRNIRADNKAASDFALLAKADYSLPDVRMSPKIGADFMLLTQNWHQMFEGITPADIANVLFVNTNQQVYGLSASAKPADDLTMRLRYAYLRLDDKVDTLGSATTTYTMTGKKSLGNEIDLNLLYDYTEDVQFGLNLGYFKPSRAFDKDANREDASQLIGSMKVTF